MELFAVHVTGVAISAEQAKYPRGLCAGLSVDILDQHFRQMSRKFDREVSFGVLEQVRRNNYQRHMQTVHERLNGDGLFVMQTVDLTDDNLGMDPWIIRDIFPKGEIPSVARRGSAILGRLRLEDSQNLGADYERTLLAWHQSICKACGHV